MNNNTKTNKDQRDDVIGNDPKFDSSFNLYRGTKDPLPVVTVSLLGGKKYTAMDVSGII